VSSTALQRIRLAQDGPVPNFATAVAELETGGKRTHWIWYVLPQLQGLGTSPAARYYALPGRDEAAAYLRDHTLRSRLFDITRVIAGRLDRGAPLEPLMGSRVDALKTVSSLTLFDRVGRDLEHGEDGALAADCAVLSGLTARILSKAEAQGFPPCAFTLERLR
jgi:uncharacterized protein (DUF1810 family)